MPVQRNKNLKYARIPYTEIEDLLKYLVNLFDDFLMLKGFPPETERYISYLTLVDIIIRVDKRKAYYQCFHSMQINEYKEAALYAYWILKLRPFIITGEKYKKNREACIINETFVIYFIGFVLEKFGRIKWPDIINDSYAKFLEYSFRFRNFSIDSFVVLIESISTETLEKDYPDLSEHSGGKQSS